MALTSSSVSSALWRRSQIACRWFSMLSTSRICNNEWTLEIQMTEKVMKPSGMQCLDKLHRPLKTFVFVKAAIKACCFLENRWCSNSVILSMPLFAVNMNYFSSLVSLYFSFKEDAPSIYWPLSRLLPLKIGHVLSMSHVITEAQHCPLHGTIFELQYDTNKSWLWSQPTAKVSY